MPVRCGSVLPLLQVYLRLLDSLSKYFVRCWLFRYGASFSYRVVIGNCALLVSMNVM